MLKCGFTGEFECANEFYLPEMRQYDAARVSVTRRVRLFKAADARPFNAGKREEVKRRVKHRQWADRLILRLQCVNAGWRV